MAPALAVDLDGTLVRGDLSGESLLAYLRSNPLRVFLVLGWARKGRAYAKRRLAERVVIDYSALPYRSDVLDFVATQRAAGRRTCLATGSDELLARPLAERLGCFDDVIASDGRGNRTGRDKAAALDAAYGAGNYDYVGNSAVDFRVWPHCRRVYVVSTSERFTRAARRRFEVERLFPHYQGKARAALRQMRPHHWLKNLLLLAPLLLGHAWGEAGALASGALAFLAFSLCASGIYVLNDLADLPHDRAHPRKRKRPLANGDLQILPAVLLLPLLLLGAGLLSLALPAAFQGVLSLYAVVTIAYSAGLKRVPVVDVLVLGALYALRVVAGGAALGIPLSHWLLVFAMFLFLSLALMKRFTELRAIEQGVVAGGGRGYRAGDSGFVLSLGAASGYCSVLVLALYFNSDAVGRFYDSAATLWLMCPLVLFWLSHMWYASQRGRMPDDPIMFAVRDPVSLGCAAAMAALFAVAH